MPPESGSTWVAGALGELDELEQLRGPAPRITVAGRSK